MLSAIDTRGYLFQVRSVFLVVSALEIVWVYLAGWVLTRRWWQATLAAAIFGLSWELAYHARWMTNDCLLAQFSALCLLLLAPSPPGPTRLAVGRGDRGGARHRHQVPGRAGCWGR